MIRIRANNKKNILSKINTIFSLKMRMRRFKVEIVFFCKFFQTNRQKSVMDKPALS